MSRPSILDRLRQLFTARRYTYIERGLIVTRPTDHDRIPGIKSRKVLDNYNEPVSNKSRTRKIKVECLASTCFLARNDEQHIPSQLNDKCLMYHMKPLYTRCRGSYYSQLIDRKC